MTKPKTTELEIESDSAQREYIATLEALREASKPLQTGGNRNFRDITRATGFKTNWLSSLLNGKVQAGYVKTRRLQSFLVNGGYLKNLTDTVISQHDENLKA